MRFLGIILRDLRLEVFVYNIYITDPQFQTTFAQGEEGVKSVVEVTVIAKRKTPFVSITFKNSTSGLRMQYIANFIAGL